MAKDPAMWELVAKGACSKERVKGGRRRRHGQTDKGNAERTEKTLYVL